MCLERIRVVPEAAEEALEVVVVAVEALVAAEEVAEVISVSLLSVEEVPSASLPSSTKRWAALIVMLFLTYYLYKR